ncbi:DNA ligase D [Variovorax sp. J22R133]|uniref:DNA ligase D n=1 Tax=Variovorax brevis TaxID=3053503 RepID=UPI002575C7B0|nr:DNA ligase D [Variovorax sp. J22R133]MDM0110682.1 DNA ligase D [Variovorax sp. J22R133]
MARVDPLERYKSKRNFALTPEPAEDAHEASTPGRLQFVVQKHWASRLHYDFRIELDGAMKSWAVPRGPSYDQRDKRMAVHVEDHPLSYNAFEGTIPAKQYGAGKVEIWDKGTWEPIGDPHEGLRKGDLKFLLHGYKLRGKWVLVRIKSKDDKQDAWLLIKERDQYMRPASEFSVVDEFPDSVAALPMPGADGATATQAASKPATRRRAASGLPELATKATMPAKLSPMLAALVDAPPGQPDNWVYEIKFDGYRMLARIDADGVRLFTRNGHDWSARLPHLVEAIGRMKLKHGWLDGEVVVLGPTGITDFQALQNAFDNSKTQEIVYFLFDLPWYDGHDLTQVPLIERRAFLQSLMKKPPKEIRLSESFDASPQDLMASAGRLGLEGIIGKRKSSAYSARRSSDWIKLKCTRRQEFVVGGYTDPKGSRVGIGALLLGVHDDKGDLVYAGNVGTGFNDQALVQMLERLKKIAVKERPFKDKTEIDRLAHWVKPVLVVEVTFSDWTASGHVRHPVFHAVREDKPAKAIVREQAVVLKGADTPRPAPHALPAKFKVSNPERVVDPSTGVTKIEIVRFYGLIGPLMMEHLKGRPVSLVRAPTGITGELFFQKHLDKGGIDGIAQIDPAIWPGHEQMLEVASLQGLIAAAQMNVIEFHTWNAVKTSTAKPDRMTFDLDPGEGVAWNKVQQAAELVRVFLDQLGLVSFCKTSGGKGLHVVVPLKKQHGWDTVKDFSEAIVVHLARTLPQLFVAKSGPKNRVGKIFIDYLRNGFGATTVCAWSARARPGLGVSVPIEWGEVSTIHSGAQWTVQNIHTRLDKGNEPWRDYAKSVQAIGPAMKLLGFAPSPAGRGPG